MNLIDIMAPLAQPFALQDIDFLPKSQFEKNGKTMCIGLPFADKRVYEDRLNQVCPGEWSSQMNVIVAGSKIIAVATVTICGVPHTDVGEANMGENSATEAAAQAFKRACSQVGLGRFLYALEKQYLPYDKTKKRFALTDQEMLAAVRSMYRNAGLLSSTPASAPAPVDRDTSDQPATRSTSDTKAAERARQASPEVKPLQKRAGTLGLAKTSQEWMDYKARVLGHEVLDADLTRQQIDALSGDLTTREKAKQPAGVRS